MEEITDIVDQTIEAVDLLCRTANCKEAYVKWYHSEVKNEIQLCTGRRRLLINKNTS